MSSKHPTVVSDIMATKVATLREEQNLSDVQDALRFFEFRHAPVVDGDRLVGIVSMADVLRAAASAYEKDGLARTLDLANYLFVSEVMTTEVHTVTPDTLLTKAAQTMRFYKIDCLPVVEDGDRLVGLVTTTDFLTLAIHLCENPW